MQLVPLHSEPRPAHLGVPPPKEPGNGPGITVNVAGCEGRIIGKGGAIIRELQERFNVRIQIHKDQGTCEVAGVGAEAGAAEVRRMVEEAANEPQRPGFPGGGGFMGGGFNPALPPGRVAYCVSL
jgi:rRNA processing protein Krr1/Pno1